MNRDHRISDSAARVGVCLATFVNREKGTAWPSIETLSRTLGKSKRAVQRAVVELEEHGHLQVQRGAGRSHTSLYLPQVIGSPEDRPQKEKVSSVAPIRPAKGAADGAFLRRPSGGRRADVMPLEKGAIRAAKGCHGCHPEPSEEPSEKILPPSPPSKREAVRDPEGLDVEFLLELAADYPERRRPSYVSDGLLEAFRGVVAKGYEPGDLRRAAQRYSSWATEEPYRLGRIPRLENWLRRGNFEAFLGTASQALPPKSEKSEFA